MIVNALEFINYRNLSDNRIEPAEKVNVIYGNNAQGKTNLLEAVWLFSGGHSFRGAKDSELITFGKNKARLYLEFFSGKRDQKAEILYQSSKKEVIINNVKKSSAAFLSQHFSAVVFSPEHLTLIKNGPSLRRKFIDGSICQQDLRYAVRLNKYNQTLQQRNALLKEINKHKELKDTLEIWDDVLIDLGADIILKRLEFLEKLKVSAKELHEGISSGSEELEIKYCSSAIKSEEKLSKCDIICLLQKEFKRVRKEDIYLGVTNAGPHRDDLDFFINSKSARRFGSQGQQRSIVLSLKLSEARLMSEAFEEPPVVLLDDVMSELDTKRQDFLLKNTEDNQVFITCCEPIESERLKNAKLFEVKGGVIY
ncbi:MAG: DNA replication/repair protein RecF [Clostridia bacterium]|nr:DNA replication/repair protein RecF [Clostridia bacterium]